MATPSTLCSYCHLFPKQQAAPELATHALPTAVHGPKSLHLPHCAKCSSKVKKWGTNKVLEAQLRGLGVQLPQREPTPPLPPPAARAGAAAAAAAETARRAAASPAAGDEESAHEAEAQDPAPARRAPPAPAAVHEVAGQQRPHADGHVGAAGPAEEPPIEEAGAFDDGDDDLFGSSLEIQQQLQEAQAKVIAAEARAQQAEARAQQAEALSAEYEEKLTTMCDMNDKLEKDLKDIKLQLAKKQSSTASSSSMAGSSSTAPSASSSSMAGSSSTAPSAGSKLTILPQKQRATAKHPAPAIYNPIPGTTQPGSPSRGPIGRVDSDEEAELRRLEGRDQGSQLHAGTSNELPTAEPPAEPAAPAEPPASKPPAAKPTSAAKRPQQPTPDLSANQPKSPRLQASAHPVKCYFDGLDLPTGEFHCHRQQIAAKMRLCCAPKCMEGPTKCSAAAFHYQCYFDYYMEKMVDLHKDWNPSRCPACDDPVQ